MQRYAKTWFTMRPHIGKRQVEVDTIDHDVLKTTGKWLGDGERPWLCSIVKTLGSAPRPVGSILAVLDNGQQVGSVSGGCVEDDLLEGLRSGRFSGEKPELIEYGVSAEENERLGLPCGGKLVLLLERLSSDDKEWLNQLLETIDQRRCMERHLDIQTGVTQLQAVDRFTQLQIDQRRLQHCFCPRMRMLLIGAGQLAQSLAELALAMDYEVLVTDPRENILQQWSGPELQLCRGMPDDVVRDFADDKHSIVITLTHDPRIDDMALMEALTTQAWYVGALGSVRTTEKRLKRLKQLDLSDEQIDRLHAPVGLDIGSKTPIEIAVAIMAQLTRLRRNKT